MGEETTRKSQSETPPPAESAPVKSDGPSVWNDATLGFWLLRLWLSLRAIVTGLEKYTGEIKVKKELLGPDGLPDINGAMIEVKQKIYSATNYHAVADSLKDAFAQQPLLPSFLTTPYYALLGPVLILTGLMLLLGLGTRIALFAMGLTYISLTFGLILIGQDGGIAYLGTHMLLVVAALLLAKHNRFAILNKF